jgi:hypothetical protein
MATRQLAQPKRPELVHLRALPGQAGTELRPCGIGAETRKAVARRR